MSKKTVTVEIDWTGNETFPCDLGENGFSVDVLVYFPKIDEHSIGWFEYSSC